ncbi:MAG: methylenetetrahydrofolate reductase C-terminal domain-containing protein [Nitrospira sp.]|nr:methylenetetrahydrofolate reductase C-terminal domain-containing protein [Nitrospira sp.]
MAALPLYTIPIMIRRVLIPDEDDAGRYVGGVHKRPPIPDGSQKAECPKFMAYGPCGGVRKGGFCEVYPDMPCPWVTLYMELEKIGQTDWLKQM